MDNISDLAQNPKIIYGYWGYACQNKMVAWILINKYPVTNFSDPVFDDANIDAVKYVDDCGQKRNVFDGYNIAITDTLYPAIRQKITNDFQKHLEKVCIHSFIPLVKAFILQKAGVIAPRDYMTALRHAGFSTDNVAAGSSFNSDFNVVSSRTGYSLRINDAVYAEILDPNGNPAATSKEQIFSMPIKRGNTNAQILNLVDLAVFWNNVV